MVGKSKGCCGRVGICGRMNAVINSDLFHTSIEKNTAIACEDIFERGDMLEEIENVYGGALMSGLAMKIYYSSPIFIQNFLTSLVGWKYKKLRYGQIYRNHIKELENRDYTRRETQISFQINELKRIVSYAKRNSQFYSEFYKEIDEKNIQNLSALKKLPVLSKEIVRVSLNEMYTINEEDGNVSHTSGTTGTPLKILFSLEDTQKRMAYLDFFKKQHGFVNMKMKRATFNSSEIIPIRQKRKVFWRNNISIKQRIYSSFHCQEENIKYYISNLNDYKPAAIDGLPSVIYKVARYINKNNLNLTFRPVAIFTTAETLLPHYRNEIEKAFKSPVRDQYASSEGAPFITECTHGALHYNMDTGIIEVLENNEMLITSFTTYGTPLIRYGIGDRIRFNETPKKCDCGSVHPVVSEIQGRNTDHVQSKSKGEVTAVFLSLVSDKFLNSINKMQFIQNDLENITILVEIGDGYNTDMDKIIVEKMKYYVGEDITYTIKHVKEIPVAKNAKHRFIINNI